jgi:hypothetical protein
LTDATTLSVNNSDAAKCALLGTMDGTIHSSLHDHDTDRPTPMTETSSDNSNKCIPAIGDMQATILKLIAELAAEKVGREDDRERFLSNASAIEQQIAQDRDIFSAKLNQKISTIQILREELRRKQEQIQG